MASGTANELERETRFLRSHSTGGGNVAVGKSTSRKSNVIPCSMFRVELSSLQKLPIRLTDFVLSLTKHHQT